MHSIDLGSCVYEIHPGHVLTRYPQGEAIGTRDDTPENRQEAADQGYSPTPEGVRQSLLEHELLHSYVTRAVFRRESFVLSELAGLGRERYALKLHEEALVLSLQRWINTGQIDFVLEPYIGKLASVGVVTRAMIATHLG